ncbi:MAG: entericidin A/B family lipoprotein [Haliea sp.]
MGCLDGDKESYQIRYRRTRLQEKLAATHPRGRLHSRARVYVVTITILEIHSMRSLFSLQKIKSLATLSAVIVATFALSACNTMEGAGRDIERAGEEIQDATN